MYHKYLYGHGFYSIINNDDSTVKNWIIATSIVIKFINPNVHRSNVLLIKTLFDTKTYTNKYIYKLN